MHSTDLICWLTLTASECYPCPATGLVQGREAFVRVTDLQLLTAGETAPHGKITAKRMEWIPSWGWHSGPQNERDCELRRHRSLGTGRLWGSFLAEDTWVSLPKSVSVLNWNVLAVGESHQETAPATFQDAEARTLPECWLVVVNQGKGHQMGGPETQDSVPWSIHVSQRFRHSSCQSHQMPEWPELGLSPGLLTFGAFACWSPLSSRWWWEHSKEEAGQAVGDTIWNSRNSKSRMFMVQAGSYYPPHLTLHFLFPRPRGVGWDWGKEWEPFPQLFMLVKNNKQGQPKYATMGEWSEIHYDLK